MNDYIRNPILLREVAGLVIEQDADRARVNGRDASITAASEILANPKHHLRAKVAAILPQMQSGEVAAIVSFTDHLGKATAIRISPEQYALGADERLRYAAWKAECAATESARQAVERTFDRGMNEGGEGYNMHRPNRSAHTYA